MLELRNLNYNPEGKHIITSVSLTIEEGRIYVLTGQNGCGKSSLARLIAGFSQLSSGSVLYKDCPVDDWGITKRAETFVACSFQNPVLFKGVSVSQLLDVALKNSCSTLNKSELLHYVGLDPLEYMDRDIDNTLSGGELKRIEIASVIARNRPLVILDEPEAGIDLWSFTRLTETIEKLNREQKTTFILISHQEKLMALADQIICMKNGRVDSIETKSGFFSRLKGEGSCVR